VVRGLYVNKEIAAALGLQPATIASRLRWLYEKAGVNRRAALAHGLSHRLAADDRRVERKEP